MQNLSGLERTRTTNFAELKIFIKWLLRNKKFLRTFLFIEKKIIYFFFRKINFQIYGNGYPKIILELIEKVQISIPQETNDDSNYLNDDEPYIYYPESLKLAGIEIKIIDGKIPWNFACKDPEDYESLHRWNWIVYFFSTERSNPGYLTWFHMIQENWIRNYQHEATLPNRSLIRLSRWEPYTISERLSNSALFFQLQKCSPSVIVKHSLITQASLLVSRLEYSGPLTCNHICNNARGLYLIGSYFQINSYCQLASNILFNDLPKLVTSDGFLREGSSHYQFLFTRWVAEIYYFASLSKDKELLCFLWPYLDSLIRQCQFFLINSHNGKEIPLFGDISPDFTPNWLISLPDFLRKNELNANQNLPNASWQNIWVDGFNIANDFEERDERSNFENSFLSYPESGWYRFNWSNFTIFLRIDESGLPDNSGHHHQDAGHFCLYTQGIPILVDSGRQNYMNDFSLRAQAHNTLMINKLSAIPHEAHRFPSEYGQCQQTLEHEYNEDGLVIKFKTTGFSRLFPNLLWFRHWRFNKSGLEINDIIEGVKENIDIDLFYHFSSDISLNQSHSSWKVESSEFSFEFACDPRMSTELYHGGDSPLGWQVYQYGQASPASTLKLSTSISTPATFQSFLRIS